MLNSAAGVQFPKAIPPPMSEIWAILPLSSGCASSSAAMFVSGPVGTSVTGSALSRSTFAMSVTASSSSGLKSGSGSAGPSRPDCPCTVGAMIGSETIGRFRPIANGACRPISVQMRSAL